MSSGVQTQTAHSSNHHQFLTIHPHAAAHTPAHVRTMTPAPNSEDPPLEIHHHPLRHPPVVATSRQVSQDSDLEVVAAASVKTPVGMHTAGMPSSSSDGLPVASVISPRNPRDGSDSVTASAATSSSSASATVAMASLGGSTHPTQEVVRHTASTTTTASPGNTSGNRILVDSSPVPSNTRSPSAMISTNPQATEGSPTTTAGTKRKLPSTAEAPAAEASVSPKSSPHGNSSTTTTTTPRSRRDSLPMGLRNKKMKATDCLLFAATLLEQDAAEALVAASTSASRHHPSPLDATSQAATIQAARPVVVPKKKSKPLKKMVFEKIERSMQEIARHTQPLDEQMHRKQQQDEAPAPAAPQAPTPQTAGDGPEHGDNENLPNDADVLCGRGGKVNKHPGNIVYRKVVEYNKSYYQSVHKKHRILVSQSIVKAILNYGGRFMGQKGKEWTPICFKRAVQKTSQALRERSNSSDGVAHGDSKARKHPLVAATAEQ